MGVEEDDESAGDVRAAGLPGWCGQVLQHAALWPVAALFVLWPLLGVIIVRLFYSGRRRTLSFGPGRKRATRPLSQRGVAAERLL